MVNLKKVYIHPVSGRFERFLLLVLVLASLVDMEGKIFFFLSKAFYKNQRMSGYQIFAVKYLAEVVVEKNKPFYGPFDR